MDAITENKLWRYLVFTWLVMIVFAGLNATIILSLHSRIQAVELTRFTGEMGRQMEERIMERIPPPEVRFRLERVEAKLEVLENSGR